MSNIKMRTDFWIIFIELLRSLKCTYCFSLISIGQLYLTKINEKCIYQIYPNQKKLIPQKLQMESLSHIFYNIPKKYIFCLDNKTKEHKCQLTLSFHFYGELSNVYIIKKLFIIIHIL